MKQTNRKGFTLAELLIVVAIIAVLVAIAIPVFTTQLHNARVAADVANVRAYYAELQYDYQTTEQIDTTLIRLPGQPGHETVNVDGNIIKLQEGKLWIAEENDDKGYNFYYMCNKGCHDFTFPEY